MGLGKGDMSTIVGVGVVSFGVVDWRVKRRWKRRVVVEEGGEMKRSQFWRFLAMSGFAPGSGTEGRWRVLTDATSSILHTASTTSMSTSPAGSTQHTLFPSSFVRATCSRAALSGTLGFLSV